MASIGQRKWYHLRNFYLAPLNPLKLNPLKLNPLLTSEIKKGFKMVPFQESPKFRQQNGTILEKAYNSLTKMAKIGQKRYHLGIVLFSPLKLPEIKPIFDLGNREQGGLKWHYFGIGQNFANKNSTILKKV